MDSLTAAMLGQLSAVDGEPTSSRTRTGSRMDGYSASLRSTSRSSRITRSATSIWAASSGL